MPDGAYERFLRAAEESTTMQELMQRLSSTASRYMLSEDQKHLPEWYWDIYDVVGALYAQFAGGEKNPDDEGMW